ncbi:hypothetical protein, partial [uncultured Muribaculum sp.]|uniref:hypothetical protein n=1 Tax=uncultured Muribaculum sp. TaxID=1918613 RepID=UPI0025B5E1B0
PKGVSPACPKGSNARAFSSWIVLTLFRIALFIFRWTIEIIIYAIRFLYRQLSKVAAWGWRKGFTHYRTRYSRQLTP